MLCRLHKIIISINVAAIMLASIACAESGYINTPDECCVVKETNAADKTVNLVSAGKCEGNPGRAFINITGVVSVYRDGKFWSKQTVQDFEIMDVSQAMKQGKKNGGAIVPINNIYEKEMGEVAQKTAAFFHSPEFQKQVDRNAQNIKAELFGENGPFNGDKTPEKRKNNTGQQKLAGDERIYLFISSSLPMQTIHNYVVSVAKMDDPNIKVVIRGFVNGMKEIGPTIAFISDAISRDSSCDSSRQECPVYPVNISVDPQLFRKHNITKVPAVVFAKGVSVEVPSRSEGGSGAKNASSVTVYGDASLEYILGKIAQATGNKTLNNMSRL